jgi:putative transcriptional regulator
MYIYTAEEIKELRLKQNVSQSIFAKYLNISPKMVMALEGGQKKPRGLYLDFLILLKNMVLK